MVSVNVEAKKKCEVIQEVIDIFECLQSGGDIQSFIVKKDGDEYDCIKFILNQIGQKCQTATNLLAKLRKTATNLLATAKNRDKSFQRMASGRPKKCNTIVSLIETG